MAGHSRGRVIDAVSVLESRVHGQGVFANRSFRKGDTILQIDDSDSVRDRSQLTPEEEISIDVFIGVDGEQKTAWMKPPERFINHSCDPNSFVLTDLESGVRRVHALRDIPERAEITWDYAINIWEDWVPSRPCNCGAENCRKVIEGNYFTLEKEVQRRYLPLLDVPFKARFAGRIRSLGL